MTKTAVQFSVAVNKKSVICAFAKYVVGHVSKTGKSLGVDQSKTPILSYV